MARLLGPDMGSRYCYLASGAPAANVQGTVYANLAGTVLADIRAYDGSETPGAPILGSTVSTDADGQLPLFWFPDGQDRVWVSVNGGTVTPIDADNNARIDALGGVVNLPSSNGVDDTTAINAVLAANGGKRVRGRTGSAYRISAPLIVYSGTELDMTGCTITLLPASNCNMLRNASATPNRTLTDAAATAASTTLTSASANFTTGDIGSTVTVSGAASGGLLHSAVITAVTNSTTVTMSAAAGATVTGATLSIYRRDSDITVIGGIWQRGGNAGSNNNTHSLFLRHVDRLTIRDLRVTSTAGKYAIAIGDVVDYHVGNVSFGTFSDGLHITGPAMHGHVDDLAGTTGDDLLAFTARDWSTYDDVSGDIVGCTVAGLYPDGSLAALKVIGGTGTKVRGITVRGIYGTTNIRPIAIIDDLTGATDVQGVHVSDVECMPTTINEHLARIYPTGGCDVILENIHWRGVVASTSAAVVDVSNTANVRSLVLRDLHIHGAQSGVDFVRVRDTAVLDHLSIDGAYALDLPTNSHVVNVTALVTVGHLAVRRVRVSYGAVTTGSIVTGGGSISRVSIADAWTSGGNGIRMTYSSTSRIYVRMQDVHLDGGSTGGYAVDLAQPGDVDFANCYLAVTAGIVRVTTANSTGTTIRGYVRPPGCPGLVRDSTQAVTVRGLDYEVDVSQLSRAAGSMAYNSNAALSCGTGQVVCDGTNWKHLYTGLTY